MLRTPETILIFFLLTVLYKILPDATVHPFLFSPELQSNWQFVAFVSILRFILCAFIWQQVQSSDDKFLSICFFCLMLGKAIDFILCGNATYFGTDWLTFNTVSIFVFCGLQSTRHARG